MPPIVAAAAIAAAGGFGAAALSSHAAGSAADTQAAAAKDAADKQTAAANYAAEQQAKSTAEALAFQKQQAAQDQANFNSTSGANYGQWAAREGRLSSIGQALGLPARDIPAFVPSPTLSSSQTAPTSGPMPSGQQPSGNLSDPNAWMSLVGNDQALTQFVTQGLGSAAQKPGLVDYYKKVIKGQPGANPTEQAGSAKYYMDLFAKDPNVTGQPAASAATAGRAPVPATLGQAAMYSPPSSTPLTPALMAPAVGSLASYARRAY